MFHPHRGVEHQPLIIMDVLSIIWFVAYTAVTAALALYGFHRLVIVYLYFKHSRKKPAPLRQFETPPLVTIQLPVFNEKHVVDRLIHAVEGLDYPKEKMEIQLLDDSTDETVDICAAHAARLRDAGFYAEHIHRVDRSGYKAGALENGMNICEGEYLLILDADFVPKPELIKETINYFTDENIGMIQTRWAHINRDANILTRLQAMLLDGHLELEQTARNRSGRFFTFNGTAGIWRKSCIHDAGGWHHDTLTEDMDLSYRAQLNGWKFVFLNDVETPSELPVDIDGFKSQQHRWAKGSIQCCKKVLGKIWSSDSPLYVKMEATAHLTSNFAYLLLLIMCFVLYPNSRSGIELEGVKWWIANVPVYFFGSVSVIIFYLTAQKALQPKHWWKEIPYLPLLLGLGIGMSVNNTKAVLEAVFNKESAFIRTPKYGVLGDGGSWKNSSYKALKSFTPFIEFLFGCFFLFVVIDSALNANWIASVLLIPFPLGFFYTSISSLKSIFHQFVSSFDNSSN